MLAADPTKVSQRAKKRGLPQVLSPYSHLNLHNIFKYGLYNSRSLFTAMEICNC